MSDLKFKKYLCIHFHKSGHTRGMQRYKCKECGCQFTDSPRRGVDPALKSLAVVLYAYCGLSMSKIAKLCQVSVVAVLNWIKGAALKIETLAGISSSDIVMINEMWHFVNGKKQNVALWRATPDVTRQLLGWHLGHRGDSTLTKFLNKINTKTCLFVTDEWPGFFRLLPEDRHSYGKNLTFPIEQTNSDIRHRLARFVRRFKCTSRSLAMVHASLALYHHLQIKDNLQNLLSIFLTSFA